MMRVRSTRPMMVLATAFCLVLLTLTGQAQQKGKKEYVFHGTVEKVDAKSKTLTVANEAVEGWMGAMTMSYGVDNADVLNRLKSGDKIVAKVYEGDFQKLYDVRLAPPPPKK